ncbi:MAG: TolC family protein [Cytophagales bacterium]|nr:TolC family protein [Cytophagales bacterium]
MGAQHSCFLKALKGSAFALVFLALLLGHPAVYAQTAETSGNTVNMEEVLRMARVNSLESFRAKRKYGASFWNYQSHKARLRPKLELETNPFSYRRSLTKRYNSEKNVDEYRSEESLNSYVGLRLRQNILPTGGSVSLQSNFNRLESFGENENKSFNSVPVRIGLNQPIMAFNALKWEHKIMPLDYERSKKSLIDDMQRINVQAIDYFFSWALAERRVQVAEEKVRSTAKHFEIGKKRYKLGTIERDDILNLELQLYEAKNRLLQRQKEKEQAVSRIGIYLRKENWEMKAPELPEQLPELIVDEDAAMLLVRDNNPEFLNFKIRRLEAEKSLDRAIKNNRFDLSLKASYGLNKQADNFGNVYSDFLDQELVSVNFSIPILDWGERKGNIKMARMNKEVADIDIEQQENQLHQDVRLKVSEFNMQAQLVQSARKSHEIAQASFEVTEKRFLSGNIDLLRLTSARQKQESSMEAYIQSLNRYWKLYYEVQQITLFDYARQESLSEDFDRLVR